MAKPKVLESETVIAAKVTELKKELQRVVKSILEEDDYGMEAVVEAMRILGSLKESKFKQKSEASFEVDDHIVVPEEFRCPLSKEIMSEPVVLSTGQTYDRPYIQTWLSKGNLICPQTQEVLTHLDLIPNKWVQDIISQWCKESGTKLPQPADDIVEQVITSADQSYLNSLLQKMSSSRSSQKGAIKEIQQLTTQMPFFQALFGESVDVIGRLLNPLSLETADMEPDFKEDLITTVYNISKHDNNKKRLVENPCVIPMLIKSLESGHSETRNKAGAALELLSCNQKVAEEMVDKDIVPCLLSIMRESTCEVCKENCVSILHNICSIDMSKFKREIREEEIANCTFSKIALSGTTKAKWILNMFLKMLNKDGSSTNAA